MQLAAYRLVQEALTNSRRHAPGSAVRVRVDATDGHLCVEVLTSGGRPARNPGSGHGIVGMRQRVRMHGGRLDVGPTADGYAVRARLPLVLPAAP